VAYEFGLFKGIEDGHYFSIAGRLYEGPAVIYAFDPQGETVDCPRKPAVLFFRSGYEVEDAIRSGQIKRPVNAVNDVVTWRWPDPQPNDK
jgi:hypothetical protein